jgi:hypothetical protein
MVESSLEIILKEVEKENEKYMVVGGKILSTPDNYIVTMFWRVLTLSYHIFKNLSGPGPYPQKQQKGGRS